MTHWIFDCDDVLLNWQSAFAMYLGDRGITVKTQGPDKWCLSDWIGCAPASARAWVELFNGSESFGHMRAMPGAFETIWRLHDAGDTIDILTACGDRATTRQMRQSNIDKLFMRDGRSPFKNVVSFLPLGASKADALLGYTRVYPVGDLRFVEDNYDHALAGSRVGITSYCLRRSHNRHQETTGSVVWIDGLHELDRETV